MAAKKKAAKKKAAKRAPKKRAPKKAPARKAKAKKGAPDTVRVTMLETSSGPASLRLMGKTYEVPADQAERMMDAGQCEPATE